MNVIVIYTLVNGKYPGENKQVKSGISDDSCIFCLWFYSLIYLSTHHKAIPFNGDSRL